MDARNSLYRYFKTRANDQELEKFYLHIYKKHIDTDGDCVGRIIEYLKSMFQITLCYEKPAYIWASKTIKFNHARSMSIYLMDNRGLGPRDKHITKVSNYVLARVIKDVYHDMFIKKDVIEEYKKFIAEARKSYKLEYLLFEKSLARDTKMSFYYYTKIMQFYFPKYIEDKQNKIFEIMLGFNKIAQESEEVQYAERRN